MKREWSLSLTSEKFVHLSSLFVLALLVSTPLSLARRVAR